MKILYLYIEVMGYTVATIKALTDLGCEVHVVHWDYKKITPYLIPDMPEVYTYPRSKMNIYLIEDLAKKISADIIVISGWQDPLYVKVAKRLRKRGMLVVGSMDQQWRGSLKQHLASFIGNFGYFKRLFSHIWVPGIYQYEYARMLGFEQHEIFFDLYSADLNLYDKCFDFRSLRKASEYPHRFLYVGRYEQIKGLNTLLSAWRLLADDRRDWQLYFVGNGSLKNTLLKNKSIVTIDFKQPYELITEIYNSGCFIMPSLREPWGVVAHELAAAGLPMIVSDVVGSASTFMISGMNGYVFKSNNVEDLAQSMLRIINLPNDRLIDMGKASHLLSRRITPMSSAYNLLSVIV